MKLIAGKMNYSKQTYYWELPEFSTIPNVGDYAIVQNLTDYDLVKIVGILETNEEYIKFITGVNVNKNVIKIIDRQYIRGD